MRTKIWLGLGIVWMLGCGGGGGTDAGPGDSGPPPGDAAGDGGGACSSCAAGRECLRGVCVATCGGDLAALEAALADDLVPIANACRPSIGPIDVVSFGGAARVYELRASTSAMTTTFTLYRWTIDPTADMPTVETVATTMHDAAAGVSVFAGEYVAASPDESRVLFGYTTTATGFAGGVFDVAGGSAAMELPSAGNFDADWVNLQRWMVNGHSLGGAVGPDEGLYLYDEVDGIGTQVTTRMGDYSGSVARMDDVILAGAAPMATWPDGGEGDRIFVLDRATLLAAPAGGVLAWDEAQARLELPSIFEVLSDMRLAFISYDATFAVDGIAARPLVRDGAGSWSFGAAHAISTGAAFTRIAGLEDGRIVLVHADGALLVR